MSLTLQQQKKHADVLWAGRGAYRMVIPLNGNPHSKQPFRDLWDKGWRLERRKDEAHNNLYREGGPVAPRQDGQSAAPRTGYAGRNTRPPAPRSGRPFPKSPHTIQVTNAIPQTPQPVLTGKLVDRFNRRNQTRA